MNEPHRAMHTVSVRFGHSQLSFIQDEAVIEGVSASQFIRDAAYARAVLQAARRDGTTIRLMEQMLAIVEHSGQDELAAALYDLLHAPEG